MVAQVVRVRAVGHDGYATRARGRALLRALPIQALRDKDKTKPAK